MPEIRNELHLSGSQPDIEKLHADEYDMFRLVKECYSNNDVILNASICLKFCGFYSENRFFSSQL